MFVSRSVWVVAKDPLEPRRPRVWNAYDAEGVEVPSDFCAMMVALLRSGRKLVELVDHPHLGCERCW